MQKTTTKELAHFIYEVNMNSLMAQWYGLPNKNDPVAVFLALEICRSLQNEKNITLLEMFLNALPESDIYSRSEEIVRAKIFVAYERKSFKLVYKLIERNTFENGEDLIEIWDNAHYNEEFERTKKPQTALNRFRIRQRFLPPETICPSRKRQKAILKQPSRQVLQQWLDEHKSHPYPSRKTKEYLSKKANITTEQVKTWFANARRRLVRSQGKKNRRLSRRRYQTRKDSEDHQMETDRRSPLDTDETDAVYKVNEPKPSEEKEDVAVLSHEDSSSDVPVPVNMFDNTSIPTSHPSATSFISPSGYEEVNIRLPYPSRNENFIPLQVMTNVPALELIQPLVVANPSLYGPTPLTHFYDYYSFLPIRNGCCSICSCPCFYQPMSYEDICFTTSEETYQSPVFDPCYQNPYRSLGHLTRFHAASALLELSLMR